MRVRVRCGSGFVEADGDVHTDIFEQLAALEEAFSESACGKCKGEDLRRVVRENDGGDKFYEVHCTNPKCRARLRMSQRKKSNNLYPRRKAIKDDASGLPEGEWLPDNGWMRWSKAENKEV